MGLFDTGVFKAEQGGSPLDFSRFCGSSQRPRALLRENSFLIYKRGDQALETGSVSVVSREGGGVEVWSRSG